MEPVLIVEDHVNTRKLIVKALARSDYHIIEAASGKEALRILDEKNVKVILTDLLLPDMKGLQILERIRTVRPEIPVIIITGHGTVEEAVSAMKNGAYDFLTKPIDLKILRVLMRKALEKYSLVLENFSLKRQLKEKYNIQNIIGVSDQIRDIFQVIAQVAPTKSTVLIEGESGTGKELVANAVHYNSPRADRPFIKVNCSAFAESLLESELFGHEKGAFTGAVERKPGRFELAHGGTLFLDEIGETSPHTQIRLLRVLQEKEFERVGGTETIKVDVRLIAATNKDLSVSLENNEFREDLYYRLNVVKISIPPLRERKEDIAVLANHFIEKYSRDNGKDIKGISEETMDVLAAYLWPGNVRELENCIERAVLLTQHDRIMPEDLPPKLLDELRAKERWINIKVGTPIEEVNKEIIRQTLHMVDGNRAHAARLLKIGERTLYRKLKEKEYSVSL